MKAFNRIAAALVIAGAALTFTGCDNFERTTFNVLSSSKAVIDDSQAKYEARTIPHNECVYSLINNAKAAQTVAVNAMVTYEQVKAAGKDLSAQTAVVVADLASLAPLVVQVKTFVSNPASACGGAK